MKLSLLWAAPLLPLFAGCNDAGSIITNNPAKLEVRDFKMTVKDTLSSTDYEGRGTLLAKDRLGKSSAAQVWLTYKIEPDVHPYRIARVALEDGTGSILTSHMSSKTFGAKNGGTWTPAPPIKLHGWDVIGYIPLERATVTFSDTASPNSAGKAQSSKAQFEIRDVSSTRATELDSGVFRTRGTLIARDEKLATGNHMVWIGGRREQNGKTESWDAEVLVRGGTGNFWTFDSNKPQSATYSDWRIIGYAPLQSGHIIPTAANQQGEAKAEKNLSGAKFELRDLTVESSEAVGTLGIHEGRGTLVSREENLKTGNYVVYIQAVADKTGQLFEDNVVLRDGVGSLRYMFLVDPKQIKAGFKIAEWRILGYTRLQPAQIVSDSLAAQ